MAYITENQLSNILDIPVALATTNLRMGDWLVIASVRLVAPMRLTYRWSSLTLFSATVDIEDISNGNKIYGNLGLVYLTLRKDYISGNPGAAGGLDALVGLDLTTVNRNPASPVIVTAPGVYSWIVANNMQASTDTAPVIPASTSVDFRVTINGAARLELDSQ